MIHLEDRDSLCKMLGYDEIPEPIEKEVALRTQLYHCCGGSGPLGVLALISLIRDMKLAPAIQAARPDRIDWEQYDQNFTVRVEARFFGEWMPGLFGGFVENGTLAVRLDDDPMIRECRPEMVRPSNAPLPPVKDLERPGAADLYEPKDEAAPLLPAEAATEVETEWADDSLADELPESAPFQEEPSEEPTVIVDDAPASAADYRENAPVWLEVDDDIVDGVFVRVGDTPDVVIVRVGEEERTVPLSSVTVAG